MNFHGMCMLQHTHAHTIRTLDDNSINGAFVLGEASASEIVSRLRSTSDRVTCLSFTYVFLCYFFLGSFLLLDPIHCNVSRRICISPNNATHARENATAARAREIFT